MNIIFAIGIFLILFSLILGKLVLLPVLLPIGSFSKQTLIYVYAFSWVMLFVGVGLSGKAGWTYAKEIYDHHKKKSLQKGIHISKKSLEHGVNISKKSLEHGVNISKKSLKTGVHISKKSYDTVKFTGKKFGRFMATTFF